MGEVYRGRDTRLGRAVAIKTLPALFAQDQERHARFAREAQREPVRFSDEALEHLTLYEWPGNARQLANELRRLMALTEPGALVMPEHTTVKATRNVTKCRPNALCV